MKKGSIYFLSALLAASNIAFAGCGKKEDVVENVQTDLAVEVTVPSTESIYRYSDFIGTIESAQEVSVIPKMSGTVTEKYFEVGDHVNAGDLLFALDDEAAQIAMKQAQATLNTANANLESTQVGFEAQVASANATVGTMGSKEMQLTNAVETARKAVEEAQAAAELAKDSTKYKEKQVKFSEDDYEDAKDALEDYEDAEEKYSDLIDDYEEIARYAGSGNWDKFNERTGKSYDGTQSEEEITKAIDDAIGYNRGQLQTKYETAHVGVENTEDSITKLKYARDGVDLDVDSSLNSEERAKNAVESAQKGLELAEQNLVEYQNYTKQTITTGAQSSFAGAHAGLAGANGTLSNAQAGLDNAKLQLEYTRITAPVSGVITQINVTQHNMAPSGSVAYVITREDGINLTFYVSEKVMENLAEGQEINLERNDAAYKAVISNVSTVVDSTNGLFKVEALIEGDSSNLIVGSSVKLTTATEKAESVMALPIDSVYYDNQVPYVYCMVDGKAVKTTIETGLANEEMIQVLSGIDKTSQIITSWNSSLSDGVSVVVSNADTDSETEVETSEAAE